VRTTLDIDSALLEAARSLANASQRSIGAVISDLALRGLQNQGVLATEGRYPVFAIPKDAQPLDPSVIRSLIDDDGLSD